MYGRRPGVFVRLVGAAPSGMDVRCGCRTGRVGVAERRHRYRLLTHLLDDARGEVGGGAAAASRTAV